jgi:hypothetical protein
VKQFTSKLVPTKILVYYAIQALSIAFSSMNGFNLMLPAKDKAILITTRMFNFMKKNQFILLVSSLIFLSNTVSYSQVIIKEEHGRKTQQSFISDGYCGDVSHYFKFDNNYQNKQAPIYDVTNIINTASTLPFEPFNHMAYLPQGESPVFINTYNPDSSVAILAGAAFSMNYEPPYKNETLCSITFSYENLPNHCSHGLSIAGFKCYFTGNGTENDPYILSLKD